MTTFPVADGARMLGIHPKTLHHWLTQANVPCAAHPTDAHIKCLTEEHLQEVARLHGIESRKCWYADAKVLFALGEQHNPRASRGSIPRRHAAGRLLLSTWRQHEPDVSALDGLTRS